MTSIDEYGRLTFEGAQHLPAGPIVPPLPPEFAAARRSAQWPEFLKGLLHKSPDCRGCGRSAVTGHHIKPFHLFPKLELDERNIVTVCVVCHFCLCHDGDWRLYVLRAPAKLAKHKISVKTSINRYEKAKGGW